MEGRDAYRAYLVRLWPTRRGGAADYRVAVQSAAGGERRDFADLESLLAFWRDLRVSQEAGITHNDLEAK